MLIGLVRDSVMQCFCHTCRAPALAVNRRAAPLKKNNKAARTKQPRSSKKVKFITTEIRCQEKSKGGLSYEVILAQPSVVTPIPVKKGPAVTSADEIEEKLKAAEERRLMLEAKKMADWTVKIVKIEEATRKKDELNNEFIIQTKEALEAKMETVIEKREAIISDKKEKLKTHAMEIEKTRTLLEKQKEEERQAIEEKLKTAATIRDELIKSKLERLKEHNSTKLNEIKNKLNESEPSGRKISKTIIENKLYMAELKREKEIQKKLENIRKHERHAELVRQNKKATLASQPGAEKMTASSG